MNNARDMSCEFLIRPTDPKYGEDIREYQGCPTLATTRGGRVWLGWYSGGTTEPHMDNYNLLTYSDDGGRTFSKPYVVIPSSKEREVHALDIQLWTAPDGRLFVFWVQNNVRKADVGLPAYIVDGYKFDDWCHAEWCAVCDDPDAEEPLFSEPRYLDIGFLRCKPLALANGDWLNFNYDQLCDRYGFSVSKDKGKSYGRHYGAVKLPTPFDEGMAYQQENGDVRLFARTTVGEMAETVSHDNGLTWEDTRASGIPNPNTRFYVSRTPSGKVLLVYNDDRYVRKNMTVALSDDDGKTWKYKKCIDTREDISYPDADFHDGKIYLTYDRERTGAKEILLAVFTEDDVTDESREIPVKIISKPGLAR